VPDLRGAGWSSARRSRYLKNDMADDLAAVLDRLDVGPVKLVAHDWGGPVAFIMMLRWLRGEGDRVLRTQYRRALRAARSLVGSQHLAVLVPDPDVAAGDRPGLIADSKARYFRMLASWVGGGFTVPEEDVRMYVECMRQPGHAVAGSRWYRTFQSTEMLRWLRGEFDDVPVDVPVRWLSGTQDPVLTPDLLDGYAKHISDFEVELVDGVGHWIVEQRPDLVLDRLRAFLKM
jgi:pimeloyl-ACP methyl ester carboxylesterase